MGFRFRVQGGLLLPLSVFARMLVFSVLGFRRTWFRVSRVSTFVADFRAYEFVVSGSVYKCTEASRMPTPTLQKSWPLLRARASPWPSSRWPWAFGFGFRVRGLLVRAQGLGLGSGLVEVF